MAKIGSNDGATYNGYLSVGLEDHCWLARDENIILFLRSRSSKLERLSDKASDQLRTGYVTNLERAMNGRKPKSEDFPRTSIVIPSAPGVQNAAHIDIKMAHST
ncbi:hypothetical protein CUMW_278570 [Citrus unshiu]|uniref:Uncharacterized protein n=1 Tax=Citrus unshiu TaxID=55188 RepID=A0A2H5N726_CITUN|nr:hypothetical protein CUMW_278570 [Citrus unshiu]